MSFVEDAFDFAAESVVRALGEEVTYEGATIEAVYGRGFNRVDGGDIRVSSARPELMVRLADLSTAPAAGDAVTVRGMDFTVATPKIDVEGVSATLVLKRA